MGTFNFNKIYVIESLDSKVERQTGKELYEDLLKWKEFEFEGKLETELIQIQDRNDFFASFERIKGECLNFKRIPILHLEIHGNNNGLVLQSGEIINWIELYEYLISINFIIGNNLFLTLAVCYGANIISIIRPNKPAPFYGFIGSFREITVEDLMIRYNEFYRSFLSTFNFHEAMLKLVVSNPSIPTTFQVITSEYTFREVYNMYFSEQFSKEAMKDRITAFIERKQIKFSTRQLKRSFERDFEKSLRNSKDQLRREHMATFFMIEEFPDNMNRFNLPNNFC